MQIKANTPEEYIAQLPVEKKGAMIKLREIILENLPSGFSETINYGMIGYVVPHALYPKGYHCDPAQALPFLNIAAQKDFIALYHMGLYADESLLKWFISAYSQYSKTKLDMGKSCVRFKKPDQIPYVLIGELVSKMTVDHWISIYEKQPKR